MKNDRGSALLLVVIFMVVIFIIGSAILQYGREGAYAVARDERYIQAYYLARSGAEAVAAWMEDPANSGETLIGQETDIPTNLGNGAIAKVKVYYKDSSKPEQLNGVVIESTGTVPGNGVIPTVEKTVKLTLTKVVTNGQSVPNFDMALFSKHSILIDGSAWIEGTVGTNSTSAGAVFCDWSTGINGNLLVGPGGATGGSKSVFSGNGIVRGSIANLDSERDYPLPDFPIFPEALPSQGTFTANWRPPPPYYITEDGSYSSINVLSELRINVNGDRRIRIGNLSVTGSGKIILEGTGKLYLYIDNDFTLENSGMINFVNSSTPGDSNAVFMYYKGSNPLTFGGDVRFSGLIYAEIANINITNSGNVLGSIITGGTSATISGASLATVRALYAPKASINMGGSGTLRGSIIGNQFTIQGGGSEGSPRIVYDGRIKDEFPLTIGGSPVITFQRGYWQ